VEFLICFQNTKYIIKTNAKSFFGLKSYIFDGLCRIIKRNQIVSQLESLTFLNCKRVISKIGSRHNSPPSHDKLQD